MAPELPLAGPLTDADLDHLEALLANPAPQGGAGDVHGVAGPPPGAQSASSAGAGIVHPMGLDELQGLCVAMAMGPDAEIANRWLDVALGRSESDQTPAELLLLLERFRTSTEEALNTGSLVLRSRPTRTGRVDYRGWCQGFLAGIEISETDWFDAADPEELAELLFPIEVLADALPRQERAAYKADEWRRRAHAAQNDLPASVARLADYWAILRVPPVTVRRGQRKVGRNDPCPCGSGRKFKQCHGSGNAAS